MNSFLLTPVILFGSEQNSTQLLTKVEQVIQQKTISPMAMAPTPTPKPVAIIGE